jgi:hypothetical protein
MSLSLRGGDRVGMLFGCAGEWLPPHSTARTNSFRLRGTVISRDERPWGAQVIVQWDGDNRPRAMDERDLRRPAELDDQLCWGD